MEKNFDMFDVDEGKLDVEFTHDFYPLENDKSVYVTCEHLGSVGIFGCMDRDSKDINFGKLFIKQVKAVHGITIKDKNGKNVPVTPKMLVNINDPDFSLIVMNTVAHLIANKDLTEEESKTEIGISGEPSRTLSDGAIGR